MRNRRVLGEAELRGNHHGDRAPHYCTGNGVARKMRAQQNPRQPNPACPPIQGQEGAAKDNACHGGEAECR